jgi:hypothetical protein
MLSRRDDEVPAAADEVAGAGCAGRDIVMIVTSDRAAGAIVLVAAFEATPAWSEVFGPAPDAGDVSVAVSQLGDPRAVEEAGGAA